MQKEKNQRPILFSKLLRYPYPYRSMTLNVRTEQVHIPRELAGQVWSAAFGPHEIRSKHKLTQMMGMD